MCFVSFQLANKCKPLVEVLMPDSGFLIPDSGFRILGNPRRPEICVLQRERLIRGTADRGTTEPVEP